MRFEVDNFMGCASARCDTSGVALVVGMNHQGKSSTLRAVAAALTRITVPLGLKKGDAGLFVRTGTAKGRVMVSTDGGTVTVEWPKAEATTTGEKPPTSSPVAAGLASFVAMAEARRVELLRDLLKAVPSMEDVLVDLKARNIPDANAAKAWERVDRDGWDSACAHFGERSKEAKGQWAYVTGEAWGSKKGESWTPPGWDETLAGASLDGLEAELTAAKAELEDMVGRQAVGAEKVAQLRERAAGAAGIMDELKAAEALIHQHTETMLAAQDVFDALPPPPEKGTPCPHCGGAVGITVARQLYKVENIPGQEGHDRLKAKQDAGEKVGEAKNALHEAQETLRRLTLHLASAKDAEKELAAMGGGPAGGVPAEAVEAKREAVRSAEGRRDAFKKASEAVRLHRNVVGNATIAEALSPDGVRRTVMLRKLEEFNGQLAALSATAGWAAVSVTKDMGAELGGRPYVLLSESEQFRTRVTLQLAIADLDGSDVVVIDGAELLDNPGRGGLLKVLVRRGRPAVVGMMASAPDKVPNLAAKGAGVVCWVESGTCAVVGG